MNLPPDPEGKNDERATWAAEALDTFAARTGLNAADTAEGTTLADLQADLMHWCDRNGIDFEHALQCARDHYEEETRDESDT